jgi:hypothetical protein
MVAPIKVSQQVKERLEKLAEKMGGVSLNTVIESLLDFYETGNVKDKPIKGKVDVELVSKYETTCTKCGGKIKVGDRMRYIKIDYEDGSRDVIKLCVDCMLDATLLKRYYVRKRELEIVVRELKKEANELVDRIKELEKHADVLKIKAEIMGIMRDVKDLLRSMSSQDVKDLLTRILEKLDTALDKLDKLEPIPLKPQVKPQTPRARAKDRSGVVE